jgi:hypothetical protein
MFKNNQRSGGTTVTTNEEEMPLPKFMLGKDVLVLN